MTRKEKIQFIKDFQKAPFYGEPLRIDLVGLINSEQTNPDNIEQVEEVLTIIGKCKVLNGPESITIENLRAGGATDEDFETLRRYEKLYPLKNTLKKEES
ncbi:MAG TPA: hypothetical protein PLL71_10725 [Agriterribacter sp.]|nr:hypothetical protein [Agriterribacter sp.]HRQ49326.1 hypothetical protein [Agriterribacter sp.]